MDTIDDKRDNKPHTTRLVLFGMQGACQRSSCEHQRASPSKDFANLLKAREHFLLFLRRLLSAKTITMATDQIRQMVNFILQEAHEKANEIRVKVCNIKRKESAFILVLVRSWKSKNDIFEIPSGRRILHKDTTKNGILQF